MKNFLLFLFVVCTIPVFGQHTFRAVVTDSKTGEPLVGATAMVEGMPASGASADVSGMITIQDIPEGEQVIIIRYIGYETLRRAFNFPLSATEPVEIQLEGAEEELEEVIIASTRGRRSIDDVPTRVETISGEELEEKANMKPGDIRMLLSETTGIQTQQTSATSYNSSIRIQGLDGKYTQLLKDGLPLYAGFSGGLSLMQIVPLDLQQVEVIKGASSTLYGGGAIAGLVNLISKTPGEDRELSFMLNGTSTLGLDVSGFYSEKFGKVGATVFASYNHGTPYDPADIGLTAIPEFDRYTVNPRVFFYFDDKTTLDVGINYVAEERIGGDIKYIKDNENAASAYFEKNNTDRVSTQLGFERQVTETGKLQLKNSISYYDREIKMRDYQFSGVQLSSFSELNYQITGQDMEWVGGLNLWTESFEQDQFGTAQVVDYEHVTVGGFVQNTWEATEKFTLETGLRGDYQNEYGFFILPRVSGLMKFSEKWTARLGGGLGYKTPTVFTEDAERLQFRNVLPIDVSATEAERSIGANFDIDFKTSLSEQLFLSVNTLFFYTKVQDPLLLIPVYGNYNFLQPDGYIDTKGIEMNAKLALGNFKLFVGYTLADVNQHYNTTTPLPLVAQHRLNNVLMYEVEEKIKIGLEAYYFSPQKLNDGSTGQSYWINGLMIEKLWENFSVFLNFENFLDTRQTEFDGIYTGSIANPEFRDIYAPVDGFVINGGVKIKL